MLRSQHSLRRQIFDEPGYSVSFCLSPEDLLALQQAIHRHWLSRIRKLRPQVAGKAEQVGLAGYHELPLGDDGHKELWGHKRFRVLPAEDGRRLLESQLLAQLREEFGPFEVYATEAAPGLGVHPDIYWRLVRPGAPTDVGPMHTDGMFHHGGPSLFPPGLVPVKMWIAVVCEPGNNGLLVVPNSNKVTWDFVREERDGAIKPRMVNPPSGELVFTEPGRAVIFGDDFVHGGAVNHGRTTRVSVELTLGVRPTI